MTEKNYTSYFIFKTDNLTGKTTHICNGSHNDKREREIHWQSYMYGFMDGAFKMLGITNFEMRQGEHPLSFQFIVPGKMNSEFFMLLDEEGHKMVTETCK